MNFVNNRLMKLATDLFQEDCDRENMSYKLNDKLEKILKLKDQILYLTNYPNETQIYAFPPYVLVVSCRDIDIYTEDSFEKEGLDLDEQGSSDQYAAGRRLKKVGRK